MSAVHQAQLSRPRRGVMDFLEWASRTLATGMLPGLIVGLVVGGVGSRLAMRVMTLTSEPAARGLETDFGATVGRITSGGTLFLLIAGSVLGMAGGIAYVAIRRLLPGRGWVKGLVFGALLLALAGRILISPDNPDFLILSPAGLAVAMFSALPILYGLLFVPLHRRLEPKIAGVRGPVLVIITPVLVGLLPLVLLGGFGVLVIAGSLLAWVFARSIGEREQRVLRLAGSALVAGLAIWRGALFVSGVADILSRGL
ncbi:MAG TPA: hypothetical protein VGL18_16630, partial [Actinomycetota bacterium]